MTIEITNKTKVLPILHITFEEDRTVEWIYGQVDNEVIVVPKKYLNKDKTIIINYHCELCESSLKIYFASAVLEIGQAKVFKIRKEDELSINLRNIQVFNQDLKVIAYNMNSAELSFDVSISILLIRQQRQRRGNVFFSKNLHEYFLSNYPPRISPQYSKLQC